MSHRIFTIVYEDKAILVVEKHAGFLTTPTAGRETNTLIASLTSYLRRSRSVGPRAHVVHRLDRDTSGLLVVAKSAPIADRLIAQFAARKPTREYLAVVDGWLGKKGHRGTFRSHLATDRALNQHSVRGLAERGQLAVTHFEVVAASQRATCVKVSLETGRRNQIRVHLCEAGHPVLGDRRYGSHQVPNPVWPFRRMALHAASLGFLHPVSGAPLIFSAPPPPEFSRTLSKML
jgi:23S rRNA pseudouridine1911/1915/1917 synthase